MLTYAGEADKQGAADLQLGSSPAFSRAGELKASYTISLRPHTLLA
jgi:hypothetical protein